MTILLTHRAYRDLSTEARQRIEKDYPGVHWCRVAEEYLALTGPYNGNIHDVAYIVDEENFRTQKLLSLKRIK